jgi:hypothetical protein
MQCCGVGRAVPTISLIALIALGPSAVGLGASAEAADYETLMRDAVAKRREVTTWRR